MGERYTGREFEGVKNPTYGTVDYYETGNAANGERPTTKMYEAVKNPVYGTTDYYEKEYVPDEPMPDGLKAFFFYGFFIILQLLGYFLPFGIISIIIGCLDRDPSRKSNPRATFFIIYGIAGVIGCVVWWYLVLTGQYRPVSN